MGTEFQGRRIVKRLLLASATAASLLIAGQAFAQGGKHQFNIPAGDAATALREFGRQSGKQVLFPFDAASGHRTPAIRGDLDDDAVLGELASGAGLRVLSDDGRTVTLGAAAPGGGGRSVGEQRESAKVSVVGEVIVTASKREEKLKDVPASVSELDRGTLQRQNAEKFEDYAASVPGLTVQNTSVIGSLNQLTLRGVTTGLVGNPTVGVYVDDAPFGTTVGVGGSSLVPDIDASDLQRIEVLKGPQGTLYGAASMGGIINFITRAPSTAGFSGWLQAGLVSTAGNTGYSLRGSLNAPLSDNAAVLISAYSREDPGYLDDPVHHQSDVNTNRFSGGKISLLWTPDNDTTVRLSAVTQHQSNDGAGYIDLDSTTGQPLLGDLQTSHPPGADNLSTTFSLYDLNLKHNLGWGQLMSETSWSDDRVHTNVDYTPTFGPFIDGFYGLSNSGAYVATTNHIEKFSEEIRLTSPAENRLFWQGGAFYTREQIVASQSIIGVDQTTGAALPIPALLTNPVSSTYEEVSLFGTLGYKFTDRFDVSVGVRGSQNTQRSAQSSTGIFGGPSSVGTSRDTSYTFLVTPRYHVTDDLMLYARVASGYQPGGPNLGGIGTPLTFGPSTLVSYEAGLKADWLDKTLSTDVSVFLIDWSDIQLLDFTPNGLSYYGNGNKATVKGVEATTSWRPARGLQFAGNVSYLDATLAEDLGPAASIVGFKGDQLPSSAKWTAFLSGDYDFDLGQSEGGDWSGFVGASGRYVGKRDGDFVSIFAFGSPRTVLPSYSALDLRAGVKFKRWNFSVYVKNVTDERGYSAAFSQGAVTAVSLTEPRTVGMKLSAEF